MTYIDERTAELAKLKKDALIAKIINDDLNELVGRYADFDDKEDDTHGHGKRVPYVGWYWRSVDFVAGNYYIGDCGQFVGFMENNKWDYPERRLTPDEAVQVTEIVCAAREADAAGGNLAEIEDNTKAKLAELWPLLQTFPMKVEGFWIYGPQGNVGFAATAEGADSMIAALTTAGGHISYRKVAA